jgi:hypothetical protein
MILTPDKIQNPYPQQKSMAKMNILLKPYSTPEFINENYST